MAWFEVTGKGKDSGRKRQRRYTADDEEDVRRVAIKDGTVPETISPIESTAFVSSVAGVSFKNSNNTRRQRIVRESHLGEAVLLEHEDGNRHDANAIRVLRANGEQLGYLPREDAAMVMSFRSPARGCDYSATIVDSGLTESEDAIRWIKLFVVLALEFAPSDRVAEKCRRVIVDEKLSVRPETVIPSLALKSKPRPNYVRSKGAAKAKPKSSGCLLIILSVALLCVAAAAI
ncbi:MAG TPA: HIRAN domain-containing protein [Pirellulales bacterium]|jgi:hypothetical protein